MCSLSSFHSSLPNHFLTKLTKECTPINFDVLSQNSKTFAFKNSLKAQAFLFTFEFTLLLSFFFSNLKRGQKNYATINTI